MNSNSHYKSIRGNKYKSKQFSQTYATKSALYYSKVQNKYMKVNFFAQPKTIWPGTNNRFMRPRMPVKYTPNELYLMFNHYWDIRASGKRQKD